MTFIMASEFINSDQLRVSVDGGPGTVFAALPYIPNGGPNGGFWDVWVPQTYSFVASSSSATIQFDTIGLNVRGYDVGLDKVSLDAASVPEPATLGLLLAGTAIVGRAMRRRAVKA